MQEAGLGEALSVVEEGARRAGAEGGGEGGEWGGVSFADALALAVAAGVEACGVPSPLTFQHDMWGPHPRRRSRQLL